MAGTFSTSLNLITNNNNESNWTGTDGADTYNVHIQGTNSESWVVAKNSTETGTYDDSTTYDMSATDTHFLVWMKTDLSAYYTSVTIRLLSTSGNYKDWVVANQTDKLWNGAWKCFIVDVAAGTETGTFDDTSVSQISIIVNNSSSGNIRSVTNFWIDVMRYGVPELIGTGTDWDLTDMAADDNLEANQYGVLEIKDGIIFSQGRVQAGNGATTTTFNSDNEVLVFKDAPVSSTLYEFNLVGSGNTSVISSIQMRAAGTTATPRFVFDASDTNATVTITGSGFTRAGLVSFASGNSVTGTTFTDCYQIDPSTATFSNISISGYVGTTGALLFPSSDANISNITFIKCDNDVEIDSSSDATPSFVNFVHDDNAGDYDVNNTSGGAVTVALSGTANANSYNSGGSAVTFSSSVLLSLTVKDQAGTEISGAYAYIDNNDESPYIMNTTTNASGVASTTWTGGSVSGAIWRVRKYGYKEYKAVADIGGSDKDIPVTLVSDPQQV